MSENPTEVTLGNRTYTLKPQKIGRIGRKLGAVVDLFGGVGGGNLPTDASALYEALKVFIPDIDPEWKLAGYASEEDWKARERYDEQLAKARADFIREQRGLEPGEIPPAWDELTDEERAEFEWPGFVDPYDEAADNSPTPPEIMDAIESIFALHGGQRLVRLLKNFVTPEMIRGQILRMQTEAALQRSRSLQRENGASPQTSSSTPVPISPPTDATGSPPPDS